MISTPESQPLAILITCNLLSDAVFGDKKLRSKRYQMTSVADPIAGPAVAARTDDSALAVAPAVTLAVAAGERELRLDLFRGLALWLIFIDHLPPSILTWFTIRNYGFSDATEIF